MSLLARKGIPLGLALSLILALAAITPARSEDIAYVAERDTPSLVIIDASSHSLLDTIDLEAAALGTAVGPRGEEVFLAGAGVYVVDTETKAVEKLNDLSSWGIDIDPGGRTLWVGEFAGGTVWAVDAESGEVTAEVDTSTSGPTGLQLDPLGEFLYVSNDWVDFVTVIETTSATIVAEIPTPSDGGSGITVHPDGSTVFVSSWNTEEVFAIDTATWEYTGAVWVGSYPGEIAMHPSGAYAFVTAADGVSVIRTADLRLVATVPLTGLDPFGLSVRPDGDFIYVTDRDDPTLTVVDTSTLEVVEQLLLPGTVWMMGDFIGPAPTQLAGELLGLQGLVTVRCVNLDSGDLVQFSVAGTLNFDCEEAGLLIEPDDKVELRIVGRSAGKDHLGGQVAGLALDRVKCLNRITGQQVRFSPRDESIWDCATAGLDAPRGDSVQQVLRGRAE